MAERLDDRAVADRLARLDGTLGELETIPGATASKALDAVTLLTEVYGEAFARLLDRMPGDTVGPLADDELLGHLMVLHELHSEPLEKRVERALERVRPLLHGGRAQLGGVEGTVARVVLAGGGCGGVGPAVETVKDAVLAIAPELTEVQVSPPRKEAAFVPIEALQSRSKAAR